MPPPANRYTLVMAIKCLSFNKGQRELLFGGQAFRSKFDRIVNPMHRRVWNEDLGSAFVTAGVILPCVATRRSGNASGRIPNDQPLCNLTIQKTLVGYYHLLIPCKQLLIATRLNKDSWLAYVVKVVGVGRVILPQFKSRTPDNAQSTFYWAFDWLVEEVDEAQQLGGWGGKKRQTQLPFEAHCI